MKALIDIGDPEAPQGSEPWCRSYHQAICRLKREGQFAVSNLKYSLLEFHDGKHFIRMIDPDGKPFQTWSSFVQCREPYGLGMEPDVAQAIMDEPDDSRLLSDVLGKQGRPKKGEEKPSNRRIKYGNNPEYIKARLEKDGHMELLAKVLSGEMSANAAADRVEMFIKPTPFEQIVKLLPKITDDEREKLRLILDD